MLTLLFDGIAYGMLLFVLAVGLAVTLGLMNFINLAHGAFAMAGGYITVLLMNRLGVPFLVCLPLAFLGSALLGAVLEPTLYRRMYARPHLDQVLFSIGLVFMAVAGVDYFVGSTQQNIQLPEWLKGRFDIEWIGIGKDRWIDPAEPFVYLNHSCEPNLSVRGKREMIALRDIAAGEELTFDYSITVDELPWTMDCLCATPSCRKVVRAIQFLPPDMVASYLPYINPYFVDCHTYYRVVRRLA